jgi:hypothetical protein
MILVSKVILIENIFDVDMISNNEFKDKNTKIFSFNLETHQKLESKKISHEIADNILSRDERNKLFDLCFKLHSWYSNIPPTNFEFEHVNLLKLIDSTGFHLFFMPKLINFVLIKKIIEKESPLEIFSSKIFSTMIQSIIKNNSIITHFFENLSKENFLWDTVPVGFNIGKKNFSFNLSQKKYNKLKNYVELISYNLFKLKFNFNDLKKKNLVFLEFNVIPFSKLFKEMKNFDGNIILVNQRRPAVWNKTSFDIIRKTNCKVLQLNKILTVKEKNNISLLTRNFSDSFNDLWKNFDFSSNLFQFEGISLWNVLKNYLINLYSDKLFSNMQLIASIKKFSNQVDLTCIISLNEIGETEKTFLEFNKKNIPSILLQHGFSDKNDRLPEVKRHDALGSYDKFNDKIAVWSEMKKRYLIENYNIDPKRIIVTGSPKHDVYFSSRLKKKNYKEKTILLAPNPISDMTGLSTTKLKLEFNEFIKKLIFTIKNFKNVELIVKLHPFPLKHNEEIKSLIKEIDENIPIYLSNSIIDTINSSDVVLVVSPEPGTTTMLLESMILGKPTMNIYFEKEIPKFNHVEHDAVFSLLNDCDIKENINKILFDENFQTELIQNADSFISNFLNNRGNSSKTFSEVLKSY